MIRFALVSTGLHRFPVICNSLWETFGTTKNWHPPKTYKNLKSWAPRYPPSSVLEYLGYHLGIVFPWNFRFYHNVLKPPKCLHIKHFGGFSTFRNSHIPSKFQLRFQAFPDASFWMSCFEILAHPGAKMLDFGIPLRPVVPKMAPKIGQMVPTRVWRCNFLGIPEPACFQDSFRSAPG